MIWGHPPPPPPHKRVYASYTKKVVERHSTGGAISLGKGDRIGGTQSIRRHKNSGTYSLHASKFCFGYFRTGEGIGGPKTYEGTETLVLCILNSLHASKVLYGHFAREREWGTQSKRRYRNSGTLYTILLLRLQSSFGAFSGFVTSWVRIEWMTNIEDPQKEGKAVQ